MNRKKILYLLIAIFILNVDLYSQSKGKDRSGFYIGVNIGAYFGNTKDALFYNGSDKNPNSIDSLISIDYASTSSFRTQVEDALKDNLKTNKDGHFYIAYPSKMKYSFAPEIGLNAGYNFNNNFSVFVEINTVRLSTGGVFYIELVSPPQNPDDYYNTAKGEIHATENRTDSNLGIHYSFDTGSDFLPFFETGMNILNVAVVKHDIELAGIERSIINYYTDGYTVNTNHKQGGTGLGAFVAGGVQFPFNEKIYCHMGVNAGLKRVQLFEKQSTLNGAIFLRVML